MAKRSAPTAAQPDAAGIAGKSVVINVDEAVEQASAAGGEVYGVAADVTRQREVIRVFQEADKRFGKRLDILINNAATSGDALLESDYDAWRKTQPASLK